MAALTVPQQSELQHSALNDASSGEFDPAVHLTKAEQKDLLKEAKEYESEYSDVQDDSLSEVTTFAEKTTSSGFNITRKFAINSYGLQLVQLPFPSRQLEIDILDLTTNQIAYTSTRQKTRSGNATLSSPSKGDLIQSAYKFGPGRAPKLIILGTEEEVDVKGKWLSHVQAFSIGDKEQCVWSYVKELKPGSPTVGLDGKKIKPMKFLICEVAGNRVAMLARDDETRTVGTSHLYAGNGGHLWVDEQTLKVHGLSEELLIATCIMMLKKEMDRRRSCQFAVMMAVASGGS